MSVVVRAGDYIVVRLFLADRFVPVTVKSLTHFLPETTYETKDHIVRQCLHQFKDGKKRYWQSQRTAFGGCAGRGCRNRIRRRRAGGAKQVLSEMTVADIATGR